MSEVEILDPSKLHGTGVPGMEGATYHRHYNPKFPKGWYDHYHPLTVHGPFYVEALNDKGEPINMPPKTRGQAAVKAAPVTPSVNVADAIATLNGIFATDPEAIQELFLTRVNVNDEMGEHPTVQVGPSEEVDADGDPLSYVVGLLGIINGIFGIRDDGYGWVSASWTEEGALEGFELTTDEMVAELSAEE